MVNALIQASLMTSLRFNHKYHCEIFNNGLLVSFKQCYLDFKVNNSIMVLKDKDSWSIYDSNLITANFNNSLWMFVYYYSALFFFLCIFASTINILI